jgi:hypothetical protein
MAMDHYDILNEIYKTHAQIGGTLLSETQLASRILEITAYAERLVDENLQHDLMVVRSLICLRRNQQALARLFDAVLRSAGSPE